MAVLYLSIDNAESYSQKWLYEQKTKKEGHLDLIDSMDASQYHIIKKNGGKLEIALRVAY